MKKKISAFVLALVMTLSLIPTPALAANPFTNPDSLRQRMKPILDVLPTDLRRPACPTTVLEVIWNHDVAAEWDDSVVQEIADLANSLTAGKRTDREKMKAIFDWVSQNVMYDGNLPDDQRDAFDAYTLRRSTCGGYARLCRLMGVIVGLRVATVDGVSNEENPGPHEWNAVLLDGEWLFFDATWNMWDIGQYYHAWTSAILYDDIYQWDIRATEVGTPNMINFTPRQGFIDQCPANVVIPDTVTQVATFYGCPNLETLTLSDSVTRIAACGNNPKLKSVTFGKGIVNIGSNAFSDCTSLKSINIPNSVTTIEGMAFSNTGLTSVTIPSSVTTLSEAVFHECADLTSVTIPNSVTSIDRMLFQGCTSLTDVVIPNGVTSIGDQAFMGCTNLERVTIPDGVTTIGGLAFFECENLKYADLPDSVTDLDPSAFSGCPNLQLDATLPTGMTTIPAYMFRDRTDITSFTIPDGVTSIGSQAFQGCTGLTSITIPGSVTSIEGSAFSGCSSLTSVTISDGVTEIGSYAFAFTGLTSVTIPDSVTSIGESAFSGCSNLTSVILPSGVIEMNDAFGGGTPWWTNWLKNQGEFAVMNNMLLKYQGTGGAVTIPGGITAIEGGAFSFCRGLTSVTIPYNVTRIGDESFYGCYDLTDVTIPNSVTSIGVRAFDSCANLTAVTIPNSVTSIESQAFKDCKGLTAMTIPDSVTSIDYRAFEGCTSLTAVAIPDGVTSIEFQVFGGCKNLKSVGIPESVTVIDNNAFWGAGLTDVYYGGTRAQWEAIEIHYTNDKVFNSIAIHYNSTMPGAPAAGKTKFSDVPAGAYYEDAVAWAVEKNITAGTSATTFSPDSTCTTAQILSFLWRANGSPEPASGGAFSDVSSNDYYYKAALWAKEKDLVSGNTFNGNTPCTRSATVTYLWKLAGSPAASGGSFTDVPSGADYAQAVAWAVEKGVTSGTGENQFSPDDTCTRGQIATFLYRDLAK